MPHAMSIHDILVFLESEDFKRKLAEKDWPAETKARFLDLIAHTRALKQRLSSTGTADTLLTEQFRGTVKLIGALAAKLDPQARGDEQVPYDLDALEANLKDMKNRAQENNIA